jgi:hypothetical protein
VQRPRKPKLFLEAPGPIKPVQQSKQAVDLAHEHVAFEQAPFCGGAEQRVRLLDPVRDRRCALVEPLDFPNQRALAVR